MYHCSGLFPGIAINTTNQKQLSGGKCWFGLQVTTQHRGEPRRELMEESLLVCSLWVAQLPFRHSQGSLPTVDWVLLHQLGRSVLDNSSVNVPFLLVVLGCVKLFSQEAYLGNVVNTRTHSVPAPKILKEQSKCTINTCQMNKWTNELMLLYRQEGWRTLGLPWKSLCPCLMTVVQLCRNMVESRIWYNGNSLGGGNPARPVCPESSQL